MQYEENLYFSSSATTSIILTAKTWCSFIAFLS